MPAPYAGNPANYPASVDVLSGGDAPNTANFNTAYEGTLDRTAYLKARSSSVGQSWAPAFLATAAAVISSEAPLQVVAACWNPNTYQWAILISNDNAGGSNKRTSAYVSFGLDGAAGLVAHGLLGINGLPANAGVAVDPNNTSGYIAAQLSGTAVKAFKCVAGVWTLVRTDAATMFTDSPVAVGALGDYAFYVTETNANNIKIASTDDSGVTWSDHSGAVAAGLVPGIAIASSGSLAIVACTYGAGDIDEYFTSPDGVTWTDRTFSFLGADDELTGVTWFDAATQFVASVQTDISTTPGTAFYSSEDGITWTLIATGPDILIGSIAFCRDVLVCSSRDTVASPYSSYLIFSEDGGVTWYRSQAGFAANIVPPTVSPNGWQRPTLVAADTQMLAFNTFYGRFSAISGLPPSSY